MNTFDFDYWSTLAKTDPKQFERERRAVIEQSIQNCNPKNHTRLRQLQWRIDGIRMRHMSATGVLVEMQELMHEHADELRELWLTLVHIVAKYNSETTDIHTELESMYTEISE